ncbi:MAG: hypothetical protein H6Q13_1647 [Bacteroidetes bacterium]|nr:hypothetical protein [Bacteroidota bacterium]
MKKNNLNSDIVSKGKAKNDHQINYHVCSSNASNIGRCLSKDTMILMADGSLKKIDSIHIGDTILGEGGDTMSVSVVWTGYEDLLYKIQVNNATLSMSRNHPIQTCDGVVRAVDLKVGMKVCLVNEETGVIDAVEDIFYNDVVYNLSLNGGYQLIVANGFIVGSMDLQNTLF